MTNKHQATIDALMKTAAERAPKLLHELSVSMASFIAEIDSDSSKVAAYIEQRLAPLIHCIRTDERVRLAVDSAARDQRKLMP